MANASAEQAPEDNGETRDYSELNQCVVLRDQPRTAFAVRLWWQRLVLPPDELKKLGVQGRPWSPGLRAVLRRSESPEAAVLTEGFWRLWNMQEQVLKDRELDLVARASVAMLIAEVRRDGEGQTFAAAAGSEKGDTGEPIVSALRFQQLQDSQTPEELVRRMRRLLAMVQGEPISPVRLADDILLWFVERSGKRWPDNPGRRLAFRWAEGYFGQIAQYKSIDA